MKTFLQIDLTKIIIADIGEVQNNPYGHNGHFNSYEAFDYK